MAAICAPNGGRERFVKRVFEARSMGKVRKGRPALTWTEMVNTATETR